MQSYLFSIHKVRRSTPPWKVQDGPDPPGGRGQASHGLLGLHMDPSSHTHHTLKGKPASSSLHSPWPSQVIPLKTYLPCKVTDKQFNNKPI